MAHDLTKTNIETGEIVHVAAFDATQYLASLNTDHQQAMARAYDAACKALIGPNDVQKEGGREFKKKSAWRKLARHFVISTQVVGVQREFVGDIFLATVTVKASGPWGQSSDAVGACATDEATGRRVITMADAIATAETRATNRAVSNLIAMGEVSAEEIGDRPSHGPAPRARPASTEGPVLPFGKSRGKPLSQMAEDDLRGALAWAHEKGKFEEFQRDAEAELKRREPTGTITDRDVFNDDWEQLGVKS